MTKKVKVFTKVIIAVVLFTMTFSNIGFAASNRELIASKDLKSAKLLDMNDVIKIAEYHIGSYLSTDIQTEGKTIIPSKDFINLYDLDDNLFAYLVPLVEVGKGEIGYITVGAIEDGYDSYQIFIDNNVINKIRYKLDEKKKEINKKNVKTKIVFIPPINYIVKVEDDKNTTYFDISNINGDEIDVTRNIKEKQQDISKSYKIIRNEKNKKQIEKITKNLISDSNSDTFSITAVTPEDVKLVNEAKGKFVPVNENGTIRYGGDQKWYADSTKRERGCGPTAAANITYYLAKKNSTKYGKLYPQSTINKSDFLTHMNTLYTHINPGVFGETSLSDWTSKVESYAKSKGVTLTRVTSNASFTLDNTATYIKNGLNADSPVATLNLQPPYTGYGYAWHWMTITKYFRDTADNRWIAVSSWGERYSINYRTHFDAMKNWLGGGLMYFN
jgi:hypothetical protein